MYDRYDYHDERRQALNRVATLVALIVNPMSNVTSIMHSNTIISSLITIQMLLEADKGFPDGSR